MTATQQTIPAHALRTGDVIVATFYRDGHDVTVRNTVTSDARRLGGTGQVAFGLSRPDRTDWEGRLHADAGVLVERPAPEAPTAMDQAEALARATGSHQATYRVERRNLDGTLKSEAEATWTSRQDLVHALPYAVTVMDASGFATERRATLNEAMALAETVLAQGRPQAIVAVVESGTLGNRYVARWYDGERTD